VSHAGSVFDGAGRLAGDTRKDQLRQFIEGFVALSGASLALKGDGLHSINDAARRIARAVTDRPKKTKDFAWACVVTHSLCIHVRETSKLLGNSCVRADHQAALGAPARGRRLHIDDDGVSCVHPTACHVDGRSSTLLLILHRFTIVQVSRPLCAEISTGRRSYRLARYIIGA
jgi:hypothetical protein